MKTKKIQNLVSAVVLAFVSVIGWQPLIAAEPPQAEVILPTDSKQFHLIVLAGQSNMAGRGKIDHQARRTHPRILMLDKAKQWQPAQDPLHFDKPGIVGVGLGMSFAMDYARDNPEVTVGLIPCAVGGSPIAAWEPGGYHSQTKTHPWDDCLPRVQLAMQQGTLKAILWHQGESDSNEPLAQVYESKLHQLVNRFRTAFDAPQVPFIVGQLGQFAQRPWSEPKQRVGAALQQLPSKVAGTAFVSSEGLQSNSDQVHFDTASLRQFGHRYYEALIMIK